MIRKNNNRLKSTLFLGRSLLLFVILYLSFFAVGGIAVWYGCVFARMKFTYPYILPYDLPNIIIGILIFGGLLLIYKMLGSLAAIQKINRPDLQEITRTEYPALFKLIDETACAMQVKPPKHVFLSATATASVFLKTGFWNAIFSANKKLEIGMGLLQFLNQDELRAILTHEFGHFSRKSTHLNGVVYAIGQSAQYLVKKVQLKKRGTFEDSFYIFTYIFRLLTDILLIRLTKDFSSFSDEMEHDADHLAAQYIGNEALISALYKVSFATQTFEFTLNNLSILAGAQKGVVDFYETQRHSVTFFLEKNNIQIANDFVNVPLSSVKLSSLTQKRIEKLRNNSANEISTPTNQNSATELFPDYTTKSKQFTQGIYQNQFRIHLSKLDICSAGLYNKWLVKNFSQLATMKEVGQEIEVEIVLEKHLHRMPLTDLFFDVYWDNKKLGVGRCRKGFILKAQTSLGKHHLKIEGQYIKYQPMSVIIENTGKHSIQLDYQHFFWKAEYRFTIKEIKILP